MKVVAHKSTDLKNNTVHMDSPKLYKQRPQLFLKTAFLINIFLESKA